jgi:predicted RecB family nuclease
MKDLRIQEETVLDMPTKNGVLNEENVSFVQRTVLFDALRGHKDLVKYRQDYPLNEASSVEFKTDFMILSIDRYMELLAMSGESKYKTFKV